jgi:hypothetical protein
MAKITELTNNYFTVLTVRLDHKHFIGHSDANQLYTPNSMSVFHGKDLNGSEAIPGSFCANANAGAITAKDPYTDVPYNLVPQPADFTWIATPRTNSHKTN